MEECELVKPSQLTTSKEVSKSDDRLILAGILALTSAICYTISNLGLREVAKPGNFDWATWVTCLKALPVSLVAWGIVGYRKTRHLPAMPPVKLFLPLILTGLFMQLGGNFMFQCALGLGGLAITVPLTFSTIILTGAILGRFILNEKITLQVLIAIACLIISICCLSGGAEDATIAIQSNATTGTILLSILAATFSGIAYGTCGVMIRKTVTGSISISATIVLMCSSGVICLGLISLYRLGWTEMMNTTLHEYKYILLAGVMNAIAFFSVSNALKYAPVTFVNICNSSQAAMAAILGVLLFDEAFTFWLATGTALTICGIMMMRKKN